MSTFPWASPFARIGWTAALVAGLLLLFVVMRVPFDGPAWLMLSYVGPLAVVFWMVDDARQLRRTPCFDFGYFLLITYPFSLIWYCVSTRGWRGWLLVLGVLGIIYLPYVLVGMLSFAAAIVLGGQPQ